MCVVTAAQLSISGACPSTHSSNSTSPAACTLQALCSPALPLPCGSPGETKAQRGIAVRQGRASWGWGAVCLVGSSLTLLFAPAVVLMTCCPSCPTWPSGAACPSWCRSVPHWRNSFTKGRTGQAHPRDPRDQGQATCDSSPVAPCMLTAGCWAMRAGHAVAPLHNPGHVS